MTEKVRALLALEPKENHKPGDNWDLQDITVSTDLKDGEVLVQMVASGICHSDLLTTSYPAGSPGVQYPRVAGHEGSGIVKKVGPNVKKDLKEGDPVLLSFDCCQECESCKKGHPAYCSTFIPLNIVGSNDVFKSKEEKGVAGKSFGQSSFASLSVVNQASILPAREFIKDDKDLQMFAPLGCGIQTGAGAILNIAKPGKDDRVMVLGLGGVGLSAVMAAKIAGAGQIIAVDRVKSRIELAKSMGATHGYDTTGVEDYVAGFKEAAGGNGPTVVIDTTGVQPVLEAGYKSVAARGKFVFIGASIDPNYSLNISITNHMMNGTQLFGCCEGDSVPQEFIPKLIKHYRDGQLPIDKIIKFYKVDDYKTALHDMHTGETICTPGRRSNQ